MLSYANMAADQAKKPRKSPIPDPQNIDVVFENSQGWTHDFSNVQTKRLDKIRKKKCSMSRRNEGSGRRRSEISQPSSLVQELSQEVLFWNNPNNVLPRTQTLSHDQS